MEKICFFYCTTQETKLQKIADLVLFTKEILNEKLHFLCNVSVS